MDEDIDNIILEALSFYTPMTKEQLILDLDPKKVRAFPHFDLGLLEERMKVFIKNKKVKVTKDKNDQAYIKEFPKRKVGLFKKIRN
ncbi:MAG: hypothetical protein VYD54_09340 [Bdellovibrionota bacterium]|nr:hypothetical protein [Bdellovibrionota bacterium]